MGAAASRTSREHRASRVPEDRAPNELVNEVLEHPGWAVVFNDVFLHAATSLKQSILGGRLSPEDYAEKTTNLKCLKETLVKIYKRAGRDATGIADAISGIKEPL